MARQFVFNPFTGKLDITDLSTTIYGNPSTDWASYSPTIGATTTAPTQGAGATKTAYWRRNGPNMELLWTYRQAAAGSAGSGAYKLPLPAGYSIDTAIALAPTTLPTATVIGGGGTSVGAGKVQTTTAGDTNFSGITEVIVFDSTNLYMTTISGSALVREFPFSSSNATNFSVNPLYFSFFASVPIDGWEATVPAASSPSARAYNSATTISGTLATVVWTTEDYDTDNALSAGVFTVPVTGKYQVNTALALSGTFILNSITTLEIQKNGTAVSSQLHYIAAAITNEHVQLSDIINCTIGDTIRVQVANTGTTPAIVSSDTRNFFSICRVG